MTPPLPPTARTRFGGLHVEPPIAEFVEEALAGEPIDPEEFWQGVSEIIGALAPRNRELLAERDRLQDALDSYHRERPGQPDPADHRALLERIGYLLPEPADFTIATENVDDEIARVAGPQLVVPVLNARFAVNAANARWGSLYDALYGTDAIPEVGALARGDAYNPDRGAAVIAYGRRTLDMVAPLARESHSHATAYRVEHGSLVIDTAAGTTELAEPMAFAGYTGTATQPSSVLLRHHGLHVELLIDRHGAVGATDTAGVNDILVESATTTIMDLEDSVAAVDAEDKALGYRNWRELMRGTLSEDVTKDGKTFTRVLNADREYTAPDGAALTLRGRSLLLVRNVGHLMTTDAVRDAVGNPVPEGILDAIMTALGALPDVRGEGRGRNSREGSMYIVKPKMHGPDEVAFTVELFGRVERLLGLPENTLKVGIMDEERRTTVNLRACIAASAQRVVFINTGFLDRTGDEIHTSLHAGAVVPKARIKTQPFLAAYEDANVDAGLGAGFAGRAQIGKGMWAMPDLMHDMLEQKVAHVRSGATTAWVPSPTAATLHALHYHHVDVEAVQAEVAQRTPRGIADILIPPLLPAELGREEILEELDNNVQSILGYVVRWIDQGVGCSKVPDIHGIALMEDRATLRISSQLLANWLMHGLVDVADVDESLRRLAPVVDAQNAGDPAYEPLLQPDAPGAAFQAARRLILEGAAQPNGYTEPILHEMRRLKKESRLRAVDLGI
jgi:malate synthase